MFDLTRRRLFKLAFIGLLRFFFSGRTRNPVLVSAFFSPDIGRAVLSG